MNERFGQITVCEHPLIKHKLTMLRNKHIETSEFRAIMQELSMLIGYEAMKDLNKEPVLVPILRAGLGMCDGIMKLVPNAKVGHVGISRDKTTFETMEYLCKMPRSLENKKIYAMDPMLATGGSAIAAIDSIKKRGGKDITFLCIIAASKGILALREAHPDVGIVIGNIDREINEHAFVCPGFGNAGDRYFATE